MSRRFPPLSISTLHWCRSTLACAALGLGLAIVPSTSAEANTQAAGKELNTGDLLDLNIEDLFAVEIKTATKTAQKLIDAPAVVSVISADDIRRWQYRSVAQALAQVPGFYSIDDGVSANVGVRGIHSGARTYNRILKLMINGQAISHASDGSHWLGEELLPMAAIVRIEVVRGPASALYGADAFLAVVNIITERESSSAGADAPDHNGSAQIDTNAGDSRAGQVLWRAADAHWQTLLSAAAGRNYHDDMPLPASSPHQIFFADNARESERARQQPRSALASLRYLGDNWQAHAQAHYSRLDSVAEFLEYGTLTHANRIVLEQRNWQLRGQYDWSPSLSVLAHVGGSAGGPGDAESLVLSVNAASDPRRDYGFDSQDAGLELQVHHAAGFFVAGIDQIHDQEQLLRLYSVNRLTGVETAITQDLGELNLRNKGQYLQWLSPSWQDLQLTANWRADQHSRYGRDDNYRLGAVWSWREGASLKLLHGTAFKAPAAAQLSTSPLFQGDTIGNAQLRAEQARTTELVAAMVLSADLGATATVFHTTVTDKVEIRPAGTNFQAQNVGAQEGYGLELEATWRVADQVISGWLAYSDIETRIDLPFIGAASSPADRYPRLSTHLRWHYAGNTWGEPGLRLSYASKRRASASNIREHGNQAYALDDYFRLDGFYRLPLRAHELSLGIENMLDQTYAEPGFGGIDLPAPGRQFKLGYRYDF